MLPLALNCRNLLTFLFPHSVHRFSHGTMPWFNIVKKSVFSMYFMIVVRAPDCLLLVRRITTFFPVSLTFLTLFFLIIHFCCPGVFLALDIYRSKFSATSPYIVNTIRNNEQFLWICTGVWAVSRLLSLHFSSQLSN